MTLKLVKRCKAKKKKKIELKFAKQEQVKGKLPDVLDV